MAFKQKESLFKAGLENINICFSLFTDSTCYILSNSQRKSCLDKILSEDYEKMSDYSLLNYLEKISYIYEPKSEIDQMIQERIISKILDSSIKKSRPYFLGRLINESPKIIRNLNNEHLSIIVNYILDTKLDFSVTIGRLFLECLPEHLEENIGNYTLDGAKTIC